MVNIGSTKSNGNQINSEEHGRHISVIQGDCSFIEWVGYRQSSHCSARQQCAFLENEHGIQQLPAQGCPPTIRGTKYPNFRCFPIQGVDDPLPG
jgi:hypothetical protein